MLCLNIIWSYDLTTKNAYTYEYVILDNTYGCFDYLIAITNTADKNRLYFFQNPQGIVVQRWRDLSTETGKTSFFSSLLFISFYQVNI